MEIRKIDQKERLVYYWKIYYASTKYCTAALSRKRIGTDEKMKRKL